VADEYQPRGDHKVVDLPVSVLPGAGSLCDGETVQEQLVIFYYDFYAGTAVIGDPAACPVHESVIGKYQ